MKNFFLPLLFYFFNQVNSFAQASIVSNQPVTMYIDKPTLCFGDTATITIKGRNIGDLFGSNGFPYTISRHTMQGCTGTCTITNSVEPTIEGEGIISQTTDFGVPVCAGDLSPYTFYIKCVVAPTETTTYSISWTKTDVIKYEDGPCSDPIHDSTINYFYEGESIITVIGGDIQPILSVSNLTPKRGSQITATVSGLSQGEYFQIVDDCGRYYGGGTSSDSQININIPSRKTIKLRAEAAGSVNDCFWSGISNNVTLHTEEPDATPNPCNDSDIIYIEELLADPINKQRIDYHKYEIESTVCTSDCTLDDVWNFMKSDKDYQAPTRYDYPSFLTPPYYTIRKAMDPNYGTFIDTPVQDCEAIDLPMTPERILGGITLRGYGTGIIPAVLFNTPWPLGVIDCNPNVTLNAFSEPIMTVIDEQNRCITNYTKEGHILYPGKITRCIVEDDCNEIKVQTTGVGFHFCGDNLKGFFFGRANVLIGKITFQEIDERLIENFNN